MIQRLKFIPGIMSELAVNDGNHGDERRVSLLSSLSSMNSVTSLRNGKPSERSLLSFGIDALLSNKSHFLEGKIFVLSHHQPQASPTFFWMLLRAHEQI